MALVVLDWDESFSIQAYVTNPGYQRMALTGYVTEQRADGLYAAPILPQLFYGADGSQLSTWRQYLGSTGSQTIISRSGGKPSIPKEELYWRKVRDLPKKAPTPTAIPKTGLSSSLVLPFIGLIGGIALILWSKRQ